MRCAQEHQHFDFPNDCNGVDKLYNNNIYTLNAHTFETRSSLLIQYIIFMQRQYIYRIRDKLLFFLKPIKSYLNMSV